MSTPVAVILVILIIIAFGIYRTWNREEQEAKALIRVEILKANFRHLGDVRGLHKDIIFNTLGDPNTMSAMAGGILYEWIAPGYNIALMFDANNICKGIARESTL